jgi:predicted nicotinamide N-methyase
MISSPVDFIREQTQILSPVIVPEIKLHLASESSPLWKTTEERLKGGDLLPPFWAFAWPGGQGAARYILDNPDVVKGKRVIDFAAGSGIAAIAAMKAGAKEALAVDIDPLALEAVKMNAEINGVFVDTAKGLDLTRPFAKTDVIFAGDICYEQITSAELIRWLHLCVEKGKEVFVCDPGRAYVPREGMTKLVSYTVPTSLELEMESSRTVSVERMEKIQEREEEYTNGSMK